MSPLESVDCIFQFFGEGPQFAVAEEYTCNICVESSDFDCVADFSPVKNVIQCFESIFCKNLMSFSVSIADSPVTNISSTSRYRVRRIIS